MKYEEPIPWEHCVDTDEYHLDLGIYFKLQISYIYRQAPLLKFEYG